MKQLKTIATAILLLCTVSAFSQTKEETIYWLKTYGQKLMKSELTGDPHLVRLNDNNDGLIWEWKSSDYYNSVTLNFEDLKYTHTGNNDKFFVIDDDIDMIFIRFDKKVCRDSRSGEYDDSFQLYLNPNNSKEETESLRKALVHLAELYGAKPAPKVDKNTF